MSKKPNWQVSHWKSHPCQYSIDPDRITIDSHPHPHGEGLCTNTQDHINSTNPDMLYASKLVKLKKLQEGNYHKGK